jgi:predicted XRE-type DNA-binding protein
MSRIANQDIRKAIKESRVKYYEVADRLGITDSSFSRLLRYELDSEYKYEIFKVIEKMKGSY